ncbi:FAD-dependent oxidoreductase [Arthrobacter cryoconiti]|uniref:Flavin-dependent monooxygenase n=1 Tax=Arthrobacter cryoconiti TaxID=748907 RepID=A0ABV8R4N4_9MICC|nr:FAD-dependent monooxygenase [Arthrobacter cryoconiti]MCC9067769.1 FAD-dependent monooxygenase [Arthrobacter cryoconiti]
MTKHYPIAIIGGGLGGLTTARVLHTKGIESAIFELEPHRESRVQGGMLDIHDYNGQKAIQAAELMEEFTSIIHEGGEATRVLDHLGTVYIDERDDGSFARPEVDRGDLRNMLIDSLPDGAIHWGYKVVAVRSVPSQSNLHEVVFANGETITTNLLIGADGAWSKVRPLLSAARPEYVGVSFLEADLHDGVHKHTLEAAAMGSGMLFAFKDTTGILGHLETDGTLHVYVGLRCPEEWVDTVDFTDDARAKKTVLSLLDGWDESLRGFVANADTPLTPRRIHALPIGLHWDRVPGVTLLGDAAHVMSPFAGEGANLAMFDAAELALAIAAHPGDTEAALLAYEAELFPRSAESANDSAQSLDLLFQKGSPRPLVNFFQSVSLATEAIDVH